jgi:hypothetical protein
MRTVTRNQLIGLLLGVSGSTPVTFTARTDARCRKNPYSKKIFKVARVNGMVNVNYAKTVERARVKEGKKPEFKQGDSWHEPVVPEGKLTPLCVAKHDNDKCYLRFILERTLGEPIYFTEGGDELSKEQIKDYLPRSNSYENQGLDRPRRFLTYSLENLLEVTVDGQTYKVED